MFTKFVLKRNIRNCKKRIARLEQKRARSQAALTDALLQKTDASDEDTDYFNRYTKCIDAERERMKRYTEQLERENNK